MIQEVRNALTGGICPLALDLSRSIYQSPYSTNDVRMLYASAQGCNIGILLYELLDKITSANFSSQDAIFKTLVRLFPSKTATDTRLQSAILAQDALQSIIPAGTVIGMGDVFYPDGHNPGSVLIRDRTDDANIYLSFISMALVGTALNRYGYNSTDEPSTFGYAQQVNLPWVTQNSVKADTSGDACAIASGMLNMFDGIERLSALAPGSVGSSLSQITSQLQSVISIAGHATCDPLHGVVACNAASVRLRFRRACEERDANAATAAGIINQINLGWN